MTQSPSPVASTTLANVVIADDHPLFRAALQHALATTLNGEVLEAETLDGLLQLLVQQPQIELVFLDLNMPGNQGLTGLTAIRNQFPDVLVVIVSANEQLDVVERAMSFGASAYVPKSAPMPDIVSAVETVLGGDNWLPAHLQSTVMEQKNALHQDFARKLSQLTPQQFKVLRCIADGLLNKQIAYELDVQETTIKQHVSAILRKLGVINRTQAGVLFHDMLRADSDDALAEANTL
ncbi:DNA-binding response regulator [Pseudohongiella acticola]|uniref:DNA-binding response regulator n=2 Tax=Pseudohongiella acticola TaxID=1524254 RepID=A0A1E8CFP5_9GAMM|nr:response regulator transcription factor [Pseudohongiella acticola]OFE11284.1 DNA-binding response regulator [Pseudohongiella acticola]